MGTHATKASEIVREWHLIDAEDQILGRLASEVASLLRGKHKPMYVPYLDVGDHVVIVNAARFRVSGRKMQQKTYFRHTGWPGGARFRSLQERMKKHPDEVVRDTVRGMLPKGPLGRQMLRKLKVYEGPDHPHQAQNPKPYKLNGRLMRSAGEGA
ncbi:MAG: 50S ribosomal protein L13 [Candidatus Eisenbacteria bacterium]|nr:50S ribosomal protein L13 [Candidatus Latescibacterota bacterium]MBD3303475.1 50S ribosomal protein L13 [Candidatus Eisenbacteria bacterium]